MLVHYRGRTAKTGSFAGRIPVLGLDRSDGPARFPELAAWPRFSRGATAPHIEPAPGGISSPLLGGGVKAGQRKIAPGGNVGVVASPATPGRDRGPRGANGSASWRSDHGPNDLPIVRRTDPMEWDAPGDPAGRARAALPAPPDATRVVNVFLEAGLWPSRAAARRRSVSTMRRRTLRRCRLPCSLRMGEAPATKVVPRAVSRPDCAMSLNPLHGSRSEARIASSFCRFRTSQPQGVLL
jgi:hypothetical protein